MRKKPLLSLVMLVSTLALLAACGNGAAEEAEGEAGGANAAAGEDLFAEAIIGSQAGCVTCHSLEPDTVIVGPSMAGIAGRAGSTVSGLSAEEYLRQSILEPEAHLVDGFDSGLMPAALADELSEEQVDNLVAYLLTLQ